MPLMSLVLHLLSPSSEDLSATIASGGKGGIITSGAINLLSLGSKWFVYKGHSTLCAKETLFMPMLLLVRKILGVDTDALGALVAGVGEDLLVTSHAVRMFIPQDVPLSGQRIVALPATEVTSMPVLVHGFRILTTEDQQK